MQEAEGKNTHLNETPKPLIVPCARSGAKVLCGGKRHGVIYEATLLENVPWDCNIVQNEVFGPVACLFSYDGYKKAVDMCGPPLCSLGCAGQAVFKHGYHTFYVSYNVWACG